MISKRAAGGFLTMVLATMSGASWAWGPVGHKAVAMIAQSRLSPQALAAVRAILGKDASGEYYRLEQIASCADEFRATGDRNCASFSISSKITDPKSTGPWHFIDIPIYYRYGQEVGVDPSSMMNYCPNGACVVAQIHKDVEVLKDPKASRNDKQTALMFLVHFVGDVHQPLHAADEYDAQNHDDYGGNAKKMASIIYEGKPVNLHAIWDDEMDDPAEVDWRLPEGQLRDKAAEIAGPLEKEIGPTDAVAWTEGDMAVEAALESYGIAKETIYPEYHRTRGLDTLDQYRQQMRSIAYRRIEMAGVRLAAILEQALGPSSDAASSQKAGLARMTWKSIDPIVGWVHGAWLPTNRQ